MSIEKLIEKWRRQARVDCDPANGNTVIQMRGRAIADCATQLEAELPAIRALVEKVKNVPDPETEGYCESCGRRLEPVIVQKPGYTAHVFKHDERCWYGQLQVAIKKVEG